MEFSSPMGYLHHMLQALIVFLGGGIGAVGRYAVGQAAIRQFGATMPYGTFIVNVVGSLAMGLVIGWLAGKGGASNNEIRLFFATGVLGGFTTFSAYSLDIAYLWENDAPQTAFIYAISTVIACVVAVFAGLWLARQLAG